MRGIESIAEGLILCALETGGQSFGIDTRCIREVLGDTPVQRVPLAPPFIGGIVSYRGELLTAVSLRALLGMPPFEKVSALLVLDGELQWNGEAEQFGLMVDAVGGVVPVGENLLADNPPPLEEHLRRLFQAAYRARFGLIVQLDPERMRPERLIAADVARGRTSSSKGETCGH